MPRNLYTMYRRVGCMALIGIILAMLAGCATVPPPTQALDQAGMALDAARSAGAAEGAPLELEAAQTKLQQAKNAVAEDENALAANLAAESYVNASLARVKAQLATQRRANKKLGDENTQTRNKLLNGTSGNDGAGGGA